MTGQFQISTKMLRKLKFNLPIGGMEQIANDLNISISTVSRVLNGKNMKNQESVVNRALVIIDNANVKTSNLNERINNLINHESK